ncbi:MAG TPA: hypothetical protein VGB54_12410 [Allosphingosinicella sp.]|jgi:hypothetical protein
MRVFSSKSCIRIAAAAACLAVPGAASAQLFYNDLVIERTPIEPGDPQVGEPLPGATPAEARAGLIWNLRAGLNVAALRCQFTRYLRSVDNYNAVLAHHSGELAQAYRTLGGYFTRVHGQREGQRRFDAWSTLTYNNFSTIQGQLGFCQTTSDIGKEALTRRKGEFYELARARMRELRGSLRPVTDRLSTGSYALRPLPASAFAAPVCTGLTGRALQQCQGL